MTEGASRDAKILSLTGTVEGIATEIVRTRGGQSPTRDELVSAGWLGAIKAVDRYDPSAGASLNTYARHVIYGEMLDEVRRHTGGRRDRRPDDAPTFICAVCERPLAPEGEQLVHAVGGEEDHPAMPTLWQPRFKRSKPETVSLSGFVHDLPAEANPYRRVETMDVLRRMLPQLPPQLREILIEHFLKGRSTAEIARRRSVSESRISHLIRDALNEAQAVLRGRSTRKRTQEMMWLEAGLCPAGKHRLTDTNMVQLKGGKTACMACRHLDTQELYAAMRRAG